MGKNYLYNLLLTVTNILFPIISFPYASRIIGPAGIGKVQFVVSFAQYFALFAALGIPIYGIKEIARVRNDKSELSKVYSELLSIFILTTGLVSVIYFAVILAIPSFQRDITSFLYGGVIVVLGFSYSDWFYSGIEDFRNIALRSICVKIFALILLPLMVNDRSDYLNYLLVILFSISGHHILGMSGVRARVRITFEGLDLRRHLKPLLYIFSTTVAASMYTVLDVVLLGFLSDDTSVGYYSAAVKLTKITIPVVTSLGVILIPRLSNELKEGNHEGVRNLLDRAFDFLMLIAIPATFGLALLAPEFISLFSGDEFLDAAISMQVLSVLPVVIGMGHFLAFLILVPAGYNREMFLSVLTGMIVGLIANFVLIPPYADKGAAAANVLTEMVVTACYFYFVKKRSDYSLRWSLVLRSVVASLVFVPIILVIRSAGLSLFISLLACVGCSAACYFLIQAFVFRNKFLLGILTSGFLLKGKGLNNA